jgi:hypothetical protein
LLPGEFETMLVVVKMSVQLGACTKGVVNASSDVTVAAADAEAVSDMVRKKTGD